MNIFGMITGVINRISKVPSAPFGFNSGAGNAHVPTGGQIWQPRETEDVAGEVARVAEGDGAVAGGGAAVEGVTAAEVAEVGLIAL